MAMNDVGPNDGADQSGMKRVESLCAHTPGRPQDADVQAFRRAKIPRPIAESHQCGGRHRRHVPGEFVGIALGAAEDAAFAKQCRSNVNDPRLSHGVPFIEERTRHAGCFRSPMLSTAAPKTPRTPKCTIRSELGVNRLPTSARV